MRTRTCAESRPTPLGAARAWLAREWASRTASRTGRCGRTASSRRGAVLRLPKGVTVIDDSYNSSPSALTRALDVVARSWAARRIAVIGEMLELGDLSDSLHRECGRVAAASRLAKLFTIGGAPARALGEAAIDAGLPRAAVMHFDNSTDAAPEIASQVTSGDVILVKGSRGIRTDLVVERLTAVFG